MKINSDPAKVRILREKVETFAREAGMPPQACDAVGLALNEALANVIRHGYGGMKDKPIVVTLSRLSDAVRMPRAFGRKATLMVQEALTATDEPQVLLCR